MSLMDSKMIQSRVNIMFARFYTFKSNNSHVYELIFTKRIGIIRVNFKNSKSKGIIGELHE